MARRERKLIFLPLERLSPSQFGLDSGAWRWSFASVGAAPLCRSALFNRLPLADRRLVAHSLGDQLAQRKTRHVARRLETVVERENCKAALLFVNGGSRSPSSRGSVGRIFVVGGGGGVGDVDAASRVVAALVAPFVVVIEAALLLCVAIVVASALVDAAAAAPSVAFEVAAAVVGVIVVEAAEVTAATGWIMRGESSSGRRLSIGLSIVPEIVATSGSTPRGAKLETVEAP